MKIKHLMFIAGFAMLQSTAQAAGIENEEQLEQLKRAAQYGSGEAMVMMAVAHANGEGVEPDEVVAMRWIREAIRFRNPQAYFVKSQWLRNGHMVAVDTERADYWLDRAVQANHAPAMYELAARKLRENMNDENAFELLSEAAEQGHLDSMYLLARLYESGVVGSAPQYAQAAELYTYLAIRNFRDSREKLGTYERFFAQQDNETAQKLTARIQDGLAMEVITVRADVEFGNTLARLYETSRRPTVGSRVRRGQECGRNPGCQVVFDREGVDTPAGTVFEAIYGIGHMR